MDDGDTDITLTPFSVVLKEMRAIWLISNVVQRYTLTEESCSSLDAVRREETTQTHLLPVPVWVMQYDRIVSLTP
jgi:hypothetical protein